jgi:hypothetical protein
MSDTGAQVISLVPPPPAHTQNISGRERCRYCLDTGYVTVQMRSDPWTRGVAVKGQKDRELKTTVGEYEELGPCPMCERGFGEEFPDYSRCAKTPPVRSPWGEEGFWKGRAPVDLQPMESADRHPVPREQVLAYLARFTGREL